MGIALVGYAIARANTLSFTHDEAVSFFLFSNLGYGEILRYTATANNHLLNSLAMHALRTAWGSAEWVMRLPAVVGCLLYVWGAFRWTSGFRSGLLGLATFLLLTLNPFLDDFFSLARGYGLALGCLMASLWMLHRWSEEERLGPLALFFLCGVAAFLANLVLVPVFLLCLGLAWLWTLENLARLGWKKLLARGSLRRAALPLFTAAALWIILGYVVPFARELQTGGQLYYGGTGGFAEDTLVTLTRATLYKRDYGDVVNMGIGMVFWLYVSVAAWSAGALNFLELRSVRRPSVWLPLLFAGAVAAAFLQNGLLGTPFPVGRTALYFYPIAILAAFVGPSEKPEAPPSWRGWALPAALAALMSMHFIASANLTHVYDWDYDQHTRRVARYLADHACQRADRVRLLATWWYEPALNYYRQYYHINCLPLVRRDNDPAERYDYYYLGPTEHGYLPNAGVRIVEEFPETGSVLAERRRRN